MPSASHRLKFNKQILSTINEPISTKELLQRVQSLADELSSTDQDTVDISSYTKIKEELVNKKLLKHANSGIQASVCCCLADILRLYAPDAPFTATQLSQIFKTFFSQLKNLSDQDNPYFQQQAYLLKRLAEVRSVILITDLPDSDQLIQQIFELFYDLANEDLPARFEPLVSDILSEIISESDSIPQVVLKLILNKFMTKSNTSSIGGIGQAANISNPGLNFSISICETNIDRMSRQVTQFFSEIVYENIRFQDVVAENGADMDEDIIDEPRAIENLRKLHRLALEIWKHVPELLDSTMGLIDDELAASNEKIRLLATETIANMLSIPGSKINFVSVHKETWLNWLKKTLDISPIVRCKWVDQIASILKFRLDIAPELANGLTKSLLDTDERVRLASCKAIEHIKPETFISVISNQNIMKALAQLIRERSPETRNEVIKLTSNLYNSCFSIDKENNEMINWIPNQVLGLIYINDKNINSLVDICVFEKLLPFETNNVKRTDRLLTVFSGLDAKAKSSFIAMNKRQQQVANVMETFLSLCENDEERTSMDTTTKIDKVIKWFCVSLPDGLNSYECLERVFKLNNKRLYKLLRNCINPECGYSQVVSSLNEILAKLAESKAIRIDGEQNVSTTDMVSNFKLLLYRSSVIFYNKNTVLGLMSYTKDTKHALYKPSNELLEQISVASPEVFKSHIDELTNLIVSDENSTTTSKANHLRTIYHFARKFPEKFTSSSAIVDALESLTFNGTPLEAKYCVKLLSLTEGKTESMRSILSQIYPLQAHHVNFATHLFAISEMFLHAIDVVEPISSDLTNFLVKEILLKNDNGEGDSEWISDESLEEGKDASCYKKLAAIRIFTNRLRAHTDSTDNEVPQTNSEQVVKLLFSIINGGGEIVPHKDANIPTPKQIQSRLRLAAGLSILKLSKFPTYSDFFFSSRKSSSVVNSLVYLIQDQVIEVRKRFIDKLKKYLNEECISEKFLPLVVFMAHEPEAGIRTETLTWIKSSFNRLASKEIKFERMLVRLIHMIAHNEEFTEVLETKSDQGNAIDMPLKAYSYILEYFHFFFEAIANQKNVSLLFYFASRVKQYRDIEVTEDDSPRANDIYRVSEFAQLVLKELCEIKNWTMQTWPGKFQLPGDIYGAMRSTKEAQAVVSSVFVSEEVQKRLRIIIKRKVNNSGRRSTKERRLDGNGEKVAKSKSVMVPVDKVPKRKKASAHKKSVKKSKKSIESIEPIRKSTRVQSSVNYEEDSDEDMELNLEDDGSSSEEESNISDA